MSKQSQDVIAWRKRTRQRMVDAFGGKCGICGYDRHISALDFHHLNPNKKEFNIANALASPRSWDRLVVELRKCVCICKNCHIEVHAGVAHLPPNIPHFDEAFAEYREIRQLEPCPVCGALKATTQITCSRSCAAKRAWMVNWSEINVKQLLEENNYNFSAVGRTLGVSDITVRKRAKKLGIIT